MAKHFGQPGAATKYTVFTADNCGFGLLAGWSRKSTLGAITGRDIPADRAAASVAAALLAVERGARVVRVHDVRDTVDALKVWQALQAT